MDGDLLNTLAFSTTKNGEVFDTFAYAVKSWHRIIHQSMDPRKVQPYLGFRPLEVIQQTLDCTTQLAWMALRVPLWKHYKARFPWLNCTRLDEAVSVDPFFANCKSIAHGFTGAYLFMGVTSRYFNLYGLKPKGRHFTLILQDFFCKEGAPSILRSDNGKDLCSEEVKTALHKVLTKEQFSEAYNPQQNPVESGLIRWLKNACHVLLDRTGAPDHAWYLACQYLCELNNVLWSKMINTTPHRIRKGATPDISAYLQFQFWDWILYLDHEQSFPHPKERSGYWVGVTHNIGDALTYWILDDWSGQLLACSVIHPYNKNLHVKWDPAFAKQPIKWTAHKGGDETLKSLEERSALMASIEDDYDLQDKNPQPHPPIVTHLTATLLDPLHLSPELHSYFTKIEPDIGPARPTRNARVPESILGKCNVDDGPPDNLIFPCPDKDNYDGPHLLRWSNTPQCQHPDIPVKAIKKKQRYSDVNYPTTFVPPEVKDIGDDYFLYNEQDKKFKEELPPPEPSPMQSKMPKPVHTPPRQSKRKESHCEQNKHCKKDI